MKKRITTVMIILMVVVGLSLMLYPTISNYLKILSYRRTIDNYNAVVEQLDDGTYDELLAAARAYNLRLAEIGFSPIMSREEREEYNGLLDVDGSGVMGYVAIPGINAVLPIYHGTSDSVLQSGAGHLEGSSLPVGGENTHAVLSGHTGLPSAKLFTGIDRLVEGDTFTVRILREVLTYEVDQILVVLPYETDALFIEEGQDYCTLLTCTPYGINSHRLLVRGHRIPTLEEPAAPDAMPDEDTVDILPVLAVLLILIVLMVLIIVLARRRGKRRQPEDPAQGETDRSGESSKTDEEAAE